jgi:hypothetical protein
VPADAAELSIQEAGISRESESSARFVQSNRRYFQDMDVVLGVRFRDNKCKIFTEENAAACILFVYKNLR